MKKRFSDEQIIGFLREAEAGVSVKDLCRKHGFSDASFYTWRSKFGGMDVSDAKRLRAIWLRRYSTRKRWKLRCEKSIDPTGASPSGR